MKKKEYKTPIAKCTRTKYESVMAGFSTIVWDTNKDEGGSNLNDDEFGGTTSGSDYDNIAKKHTLIDVWDDGDDGDDGL